MLYRQQRCYISSMVAITVRDIPDDVRDELAARAARAGQSYRGQARPRACPDHREPTRRSDHPGRQAPRPAMTGRIVCDASVVVALLLDSGPDGQSAADQLSGADLFAPALMPYECANIVRRQELADRVGADQAAQAHADLLELSVELWPYELLAGRVWAVASCDAAYVSLAEAIGAELATLDRRIAQAPGIRCEVKCP
jgi:predicted nucleic acid-binding protein